MKIETAGEHLVERVPVAHATEAADAVVERLRRQSFDALEAVYVVEPNGALLGAVRLVDLFRAPSGTKLATLVDRALPCVGTEDDQEHVAAEALEHDTTSVAVVDDRGRFLGAVGASSLLAILRREHVEDLHRLAGIRREAARTRRALEAPPSRRARHRLPWLLIGFAGSMVAATVVAGFERVLERTIAVAFFVPAIVYLADAIGTQTETVVVRGLSLSRLPLCRLLGGELRTGFLLGSILGALAFPVVALTFGNVNLAVSVALAIVAAGSVATTVGLLLPWLLQRLGQDPALGSGPLATIVQDVLSLLIYFVITTALVR